MFLSEIEEELIKINKHDMNYSNLSKEERDALLNLSHDDSTIIKHADKANGIAFWDRSDYLLECQRQLSEQQVYETIEQSPLEKVSNRIKTNLKEMVRKKEIETKVMEYLLVKRPQLGRFYLLPKIHKRKTNVLGRSVISNNQTATENISSFLDFHLKNIVPTIPHILEDTKDFLKRINDIGEIPSGSLLVTFNVVGLYPHIPHEEGIETMKKYLNLREDQSVFTNSLCDLAHIILTENYFKLGKDMYHQELGTAIGTTFAPTYANFCMAGLENKIFSDTNIQPLLCLRYLDDIFCIWTDGLQKLKEFLQWIILIPPLTF